MLAAPLAAFDRRRVALFILLGKWLLRSLEVLQQLILFSSSYGKHRILDWWARQAW